MQNVGFEPSLWCGKLERLEIEFTDEPRLPISTGFFSISQNELQRPPALAAEMLPKAPEQVVCCPLSAGGN